MVDSLRDQLLKSGIAKPARNNKPMPRGKAGKGGKRKPTNRQGAKPGASGEMDLARAYNMRAQSEARERKQAKAQAEAEAKARRERKQRLQKLLHGKALNKTDAEHVRHFEYGGKIRRIHVDKTQLQQLNAGDLGVVQLAGRYVLVVPDLIAEVRTFAPDHVALLVDPDTAAPDDGVPDDLVW